MNKFIKFNSILFSAAIFLLHPVFGMEKKEKEKLIMSSHVLPNDSSTSSSSSSSSSQKFDDRDSDNSLSIVEKLHQCAREGYLDELKAFSLRQQELFKYYLNKPLGHKNQTLLLTAMDTPVGKNWIPHKNDKGYDLKYVKKTSSKKNCLVKFLIESGAEIFTKSEDGQLVPVVNADGNTCLHLAAIDATLENGDLDDEDLDYHNPELVKHIFDELYTHRYEYSLILRLINTRNNKDQTVLDLIKNAKEMTIKHCFIYLNKKHPNNNKPQPQKAAKKGASSENDKVESLFKKLKKYQERQNALQKKDNKFDSFMYYLKILEKIEKKLTRLNKYSNWQDYSMDLALTDVVKFLADSDNGFDAIVKMLDNCNIK